jgi:hypothetical protein
MAHVSFNWASEKSEEMNFNTYKRAAVRLGTVGQQVELILGQGRFFLSYQESEYRVLHELMCWKSLTFRQSNVMSPLQRGRMSDLEPKFY